MGRVVVLAALNLASEAVSFSDVIGRTPPLRWLDRLGAPLADARSSFWSANVPLYDPADRGGSSTGTVHGAEWSR